MKHLTRLLIFTCVILLALMPSVSATTPPTTGQETTPIKQVVISDCETNDGWQSGGAIFTELEEMTQGEGAVRVENSLSCEVFANHYVDWISEEPKDLSGMSILEFDFYISDLILWQNASIASVIVSSSGGSEGQTMSWDLHQIKTLTQGWNHIVLPFAVASADGFASGHMNYFRVLFSRITLEEDLNGVVLMFDNITARSVPTRSVMIDSCDLPTGWSGGPVQDPQNYKQGVASLSLFAPAGNIVSGKTLDTPINATGALYVEMDVYVSDLAPLRRPYSTYGLRFEITSSGICDHQEYEWDFADHITKVGWNHVRFSMGDVFQVTGGAPNMAAINYIRFHIVNMNSLAAGLTLKVDNITFTIPAETVALAPSSTPILSEEEPVPPTVDDPGQINPPEVVDPNLPSDADKNETELRAAQTAQRAKIVLILMAFAILGGDILALALRRRAAAHAAKEENGAEQGE